MLSLTHHLRVGPLPRKYSYLVGVMGYNYVTLVGMNPEMLSTLFSNFDVDRLMRHESFRTRSRAGTVR